MKQNWFYKKSSIKKIWVAAAVVLLLTVLIELVVTLHPHFRIESIFAFHAVYGFLTCVAMIIFAKILGVFIKRKDDYYDM